MHSLLPPYKKSFWIDVALSIAVFHIPLASAQESHPTFSYEGLNFTKKNSQKKTKGTPQDKYTINFNDISINEYIRFVSKITNLNFIFDKQDLGFKITVVSEEMVDAKGIMSILIQMLRIHDLVVIEEGNNLLITKSKNVSQIGKVVSSDQENTGKESNPIITRVFKIKNANINTIAAVIRPLISDSAPLELSNETNQVIVTDVTPNIDKIASLITTLDTPNTRLEVGSYVNKNSEASELITLATQLMKPFTEGNPLIFVPHPENETIFIASTPYLIQKALKILSDLDSSARDKSGKNSTQNVYLHPIKHNNPEDLSKAIKQIAKELKHQGASEKLTEALLQSQWISETNSILFVGDPQTLNEIKDLAPILDSSALTEGSSYGRMNFQICPLQFASHQQIQTSLFQMADTLHKAKFPDHDLIESIRSMKYIKETNSFLFIGKERALERIKETISHFDVNTGEGSETYNTPTEFHIYTPKHNSGENLEKALRELSSNLANANLVDPAFLETISKMRWVQASNFIVFTGTSQSLNKVKEFISQIDVVSQNISGSSKAHELPFANSKNTNVNKQFVISTPKHLSPAEIIETMHEFSARVEPKNATKEQSELAKTIAELAPFKEKSIIISGYNKEAIQQVSEMIDWYDNLGHEGSLPPSSLSPIENTNFLIYKLQFHQGDEILTALKQITSEQALANASNQNLLNAINSLQWVKVTNSIIASGEESTLVKLKELIQNLDVALRQIFIEVLVVETSISNTLNFGVQWGSKSQLRNNVAGGIGNFTPDAGTPSLNSPIGATPNSFPSTLGGINGSSSLPNAGSIPFFGGFDFGIIGDVIMHKGRSFISMGAFVNALQTDTDSTVVMNPKIITQDNRNSTIFVGNNVPFIGSKITGNPSSGVASSTSIEYRDIGFSLSITPTIGNGDVVTLDIKNDISSVINADDSTSAASSADATLTGIQTSRTQMSTRVHVPDQNFVVLSGMIQDAKSRTKTGIPCLGGLPFIGAAFSENDRANTKKNVIIFVRPHIVNSYEEYAKITNAQENLYKDSAHLPVLKEEFDQGVDLIKTAENEE